MDIQIRDVKPFEQYCIDEFSMCHDDGDFERDVLGFYEHVETERLWRVWELQTVKSQAVQERPHQFNLHEFLLMEQKLKSKGGIIKADLDRFIAYAEMVLEKAKALKEPK